MQTSIFHKLSNFLWGLAVLVIVLLATYVSLGRLLSTNLQNWQEEVLAELNSRVPFQIKAESLAGEWHSFTPEIVLNGLELDLPHTNAVPLQLSGGRIGIDVLDSLASRSLQFTSLQLDGLALKGELTADGRFVIPGLSGNGGQLGQWLQQFLLNLEYVTLSNNRLQVQLPGGEQRDYAMELHLARDGSIRHVRADMLSTVGTDIQLVGTGLGNPFKPDTFEGMLYLRAHAADLGAVSQMLASEPAVWAQGRLHSELWLSWDRGEAGVDMDIEIADFELSPREGDWSVPLDALSFQATLDQGKNRRTVFASNFNASVDDIEVTVPRVQVDAWGDSLRLRTSDLALEPLNQMLQSLPGLPQTLQSVFEILAPRGQVTALQLALGDVTDPLSQWDVEGNFDGLQVDSWKGAPGVTSGTGYFELSEAGGYVVIDSQQFTMAFPTLYSQPLYYDDFYGTLDLSWDEDALLLHSGLITATGVEGTAQAMFALNIPFSPTEVGLEMDLMVGLSNSHPIHRAKYIPYTLNQSLLDWLSSAVGEGDVEQAGFIWRGSLRPGASDLRTVQLMLNVANTSMVYHPDWPAVSGLSGIVLLNDTDVSVWADTARLYNSEVRHLSAEAWMDANAQMQLAIDGSVTGSAEDGLRVVNESLLGSLTKGAFSDWRATGDLETELQLELNLADKTVPPRVDVQLDVDQVDLQINPGNLPVTDVSGHVSYTSASGFASRDLVGALWGKTLEVSLSQRSLRGGDGAFDLGQSAVEIDLASRVNAADLQNWLQQDALALASGEAAVSGSISVLPGETPQLRLSSSLEGMALDLPKPWTKAAEQSESMELSLPLGGEQMVLGLALGEELSLLLDITAGAMNGAALGVNMHPPDLRPGQVHVAGQASLVDVDGWLGFSENYLFPPQSEGTVAALDPNSVADPNDPNGREVDAGLQLVIDEAKADRLLLWDGEYQNVSFSMELDASGWQVSGGSDWIQGKYRQPETGRASLELDLLDLSTEEETGNTEPTEVSSQAREFSLPPMDVQVRDLRLNGTPLGQLQMTLASEGSSIYARDISGELAGLSLLPEQPASLVWEQGAETRLEAGLQFADFGATLDQLGYARFLETEQGRLDLNLSWPGSPQSVALGSLRGELLIDVGAGRFLETPAGTGALKVVEVFNLAGVVSSLSLSHMFESGISFQSMEGEVFFHGGTLELAGLSVQGSSSAFAMSGLSDVAGRSLDGELVATLPVANNLPWVAALAGGLPVAAGVFVVSKVFEKQVNRLSSGVYSIEGTWDDPLVEFDRIFDDEVRLDSATDAAPDPNGPATVPVEDPNTPGVASPGQINTDPNQPAP